MTSADELLDRIANLAGELKLANPRPQITLPVFASNPVTLRPVELNVKSRFVACPKRIWLGRLPVTFHRLTGFNVSSAKTVTVSSVPLAV